MKKKFKTICIIPARGGSKGLPGKNLRIFNGKPLFIWSMLSAQKSKYIDQIYLSTDSKKINEIAKKNGCDLVINYSKENFVEKVMEYTKGVGVPVVYDGVGDKTFEDSIACLKKTGTMVSFGNASGPLKNIDVQKHIQPKSLFFTRPTGGHYFTTKQLLNEAADKLFEQIKFGKVKIKIYKEYNLKDVIQAHKDLEARKIIGPAVIIP